MQFHKKSVMKIAIFLPNYDLFTNLVSTLPFSSYISNPAKSLSYYQTI